jgi:hypothetical protein
MSLKVVTPEQIDEMRAALKRGKKSITLKIRDKREMTFNLEPTDSPKHFRYRAVNGTDGLPIGVATRKKESPDETFKRLWPDG